MKQIILVGNGSSLRQSKLGGEIDSYRYVVRFNRYVTAGHETDVGGRITHWVRCNHVGAHERSDTKKVLYVKPIAQRNVPGFEIEPGDLEIPESCEFEIYKKLKIECFPWGREPSTGILA